MPKSTASLEERLSLTLNPTNPQMTAVQTLAVAYMYNARLDPSAEGVTLDENHELAGTEEWRIFREQVRANAAELMDIILYAFSWQVELRMLELATMPYQEYLKTPEWQEVRTMMLAMSGERCQVCNSPDNLHVHHRTYERRGHEQSMDLVVLCAECHKLFHDNGRLR